MEVGCVLAEEELVFDTRDRSNLINEINDGEGNLHCLYLKLGEQSLELGSRQPDEVN